MVIYPVIGILVLPPPLRGEVAASQNAVRKFRVETHTVFSQWDLHCPRAGLLCLRDDCSGNTSHSATTEHFSQTSANDLARRGTHHAHPADRLAGSSSMTADQTDPRCVCEETFFEAQNREAVLLTLY